MIDPPRWTDAQFTTEVETSIELFRRERMEEPLEAYLEAFEDYQGNIEDLFEATVDLTALGSAALDVLTDAKLLAAFRYLAGPPISDDDLRTVAEAASLNSTALRNDPELIARIVSVVVSGLDSRRFPWVRDDREPAEEEKNAAILASAALMATQRVGTDRRSEGKRAQEAKVQGALSTHGFTQVPRRHVTTPAKAPGQGEFCPESKLGGRKADFIVRLWDDRIMPVECKVSNSSTNSVKRLNNDAAAKAEEWRHDFGALVVVPVAVLSGVYKLHNLIDAQNRGLTIFWAHNLKEMIDWIEATR